MTSTPFVNAIQKVIGFVEELKKDGVRIEYLDIGGGLGIIYKDEKPQTAQVFAEAVLPFLEKTGLNIIMEPGRFIVGNAGILVTKVLYVKKTPKKKFFIVDAGMNDLIRPALYDAYHEILPLHKATGIEKADVVGPICESADFFAKDRKLPRLKEGEYLAIMGAGAYGFSMSSNYNSRLKAKEVMVVKDKEFVIRKRDAHEDLIRNETIPPFLLGL